MAAIVCSTCNRKIANVPDNIMTVSIRGGFKMLDIYPKYDTITITCPMKEVVGPEYAAWVITGRESALFLWVQELDKLMKQKFGVGIKCGVVSDSSYLDSIPAWMNQYPLSVDFEFGTLYFPDAVKVHDSDRDDSDDPDDPDDPHDF